MATQSLVFQGPVYKTRPGYVARTVNFPEGASQSFRAGDFLKLSSGKVVIVNAANATLTSADQEADNIVGMALKAASGTTDTDVPVLVAEAGVLFKMQLAHGTASSAVSAITNIGVAYDTAHWTSGGVNGYVVTIDDTSAANFQIFEFDEEHVLGDQHASCWGEFTAAGRVFGV